MWLFSKSRFVPPAEKPSVLNGNELVLDFASIRLLYAWILAEPLVEKDHATGF